MQSPESDFVNAVTSQYFRQFPELCIGNSEVINVREYIGEKAKITKDNKYRLEKVIISPPEKDLFLLAHDNCIPEDWNYYIELNRINTPEKALEWTRHLGEKKQFNFNGWMEILNDLFPRKEF